jgi:spore coat protein CotH
MRRLHLLIVTVTLVTASLVGSAQSVGDLFDTGVLHDIRLWINSRDLYELRAHFNLNTTYPADLLWRDLRVRNAAVRSRGYGSRSATKPGLQMDFDRYVTGQTLVGRRSLVLDNLWQDASMVREQVAMSLFARMGIASPLESFTRLSINNQYQGVYAVVESIDSSMLQRSGLDGGGYLYEYHYLQPYNFEDLGDNLTPYAAVFEARTHQTESPATLYGPLRDMVAAINEPSEALWRERVEAHVDLNQLITFAAVETFLSELDGMLGYAGLNNFYLYRPVGSTRHQFIPWDRDNSFQGVTESIVQRVEQNLLLTRALTYPDLYEAYLTALENTARAAAQDEFLEDLIRRDVELIGDSAAADAWAPYPQEERLAAIAHLIDFARRRPAIVLQQVATARTAAGR